MFGALLTVDVVAGPFVVGEEFTPTTKVRRDYVLAKLADEVEALYEPATSASSVTKP